MADLTWDRYGGAALIGAGNEALAQYRARATESGDHIFRQKVYVGLIALAIIGIPLLASREWKGSYVIGAAEGAFDGVAALAFRNVTRAVLVADPNTCHVPF